MNPHLSAHGFNGGAIVAVISEPAMWLDGPPHGVRLLGELDTRAASHGFQPRGASLPLASSVTWPL